MCYLLFIPVLPMCVIHQCRSSLDVKCDVQSHKLKFDGEFNLIVLALPNLISECSIDHLESIRCHDYYSNTSSGVYQLELASFPGPSCRSAMYTCQFPGILLCICILETDGNRGVGKTF